jgi:hypothetical protein
MGRNKIQLFPRVVTEKLTVAQLLQKFSVFDETRNCITALANAATGSYAEANHASSITSTQCF